MKIYLKKKKFLKKGKTLMVFKTQLKSMLSLEGLQLFFLFTEKLTKEARFNHSKININCNTVFVNEAVTCLPLFLSLSNFISLT